MSKQNTIARRKLKTPSESALKFCKEWFKGSPWIPENWAQASAIFDAAMEPERAAAKELKRLLGEAWGGSIDHVKIGAAIAAYEKAGLRGEEAGNEERTSK